MYVQSAWHMMHAQVLPSYHAVHSVFSAPHTMVDIPVPTGLVDVDMGPNAGSRNRARLKVFLRRKARGAGAGCERLAKQAITFIEPAYRSSTDETP